jgi:hypothetical protein
MSTTIDTRTAWNITVYHYLRDDVHIVLNVFDEDDEPVNLSSKTLVFTIRKTENGTAVETISGSDITVSGANNNKVTISKAVSSLVERTYYIDLDNTTDGETIADGLLIATHEGR